jgi:hypothetical protein
MYDPEYQAKWQFEYTPGFKLGDMAATSYVSLIPEQCVSFNQWNVVEMHTLSCVYTGLVLVKIYTWKKFDIVLDIDAIVDEFLTQSWYQELQQQLYHNWTQDQNYFYEINGLQISDPKHLGLYLASKEDLFQYVYACLSVELQDIFSKDDVRDDLAHWSYKKISAFD